MWKGTAYQLSGFVRNLVALLMLLLAVACTSSTRNALPEADFLLATVLDGAEVRAWGDIKDNFWLELKSTSQENERLAGIMHQEHDYLLISGGGGNGAYGAGVLNGWSKQGSRPEFTVVTGVSTGALIAPFAFLGQQHDDLLRKLYTSINSDDIFKKRGLSALWSSDAVSDTTPMYNLIAQYFDEQLVEALSNEYQRGRTLLIGTTNLDAGRPVTWDVTKIAASGHSDSLSLIRQILLASAAIPGAFPPVYIQVQTPDGKTYDEMHVDGGISSQLFFYPSDLDWNAITERLDVQGKPRIWVIRNAFIVPDYKVIEPRIFPILGRAVNSLIRTQGIGDLFRVGSLATRDGLEMQVTFIPANVELGVESNETFDPAYMSVLFELGKERAQADVAFSEFEDIMNPPSNDSLIPRP
jgi:hypothetical protein